MAKTRKKQAKELKEIAGGTAKREASKRIPLPPKKDPFVAPPTPQPKSYAELIEKHGLIVEHVAVAGMQRIVVRKSRHALAAFVLVTELSASGWASKGRRLHLLIQKRKELDWESAKERFLAMLGPVGLEHLLVLSEQKQEELAKEEVVHAPKMPTMEWATATS